MDSILWWSTSAFLGGMEGYMQRSDIARWAGVPMRLLVGYGFIEHGFAKSSCTQKMNDLARGSIQAFRYDSCHDRLAQASPRVSLSGPERTSSLKIWLSASNYWLCAHNNLAVD